jgi:undecaprenyl-diphosphatase
VSNSRSPRSLRTSTRRHPSDLLRLVLGALVLAWAALAAGSGDPSRLELNAFRLVNQLPDAAGAPLVGVMQLGALAAVPIIGLVCALSGRSRLARLLVVGAAAAWAAAKLVGAMVAEHAPDDRIRNVIMHGAVTPGLAFPSTHVAVAAAMATIAGPYVSRSVRRTAWLGVALVAVARVYVGAHLPVDVLGGIALGWLTGSAIHLILGAPRGAPDPEALRLRLVELGTPARSVVPTRAKGACFRVETADGCALHVRVVDRDRGEADWLYRLWKLVAYRDSLHDDAGRDPPHAVEHEALALLTARDRGVTAPGPLFTEQIADGESILVREWVDGCGIDTVDLTQEPAALASSWRQLRDLHRAGIAYGAAQRSGFVRTGATVVAVDFSDARLKASDAERARDVAELLASSAAAVGSGPAARSARDGVGTAELSRVLPILQPLALSPRARAELRRARCSVDQLRSDVAAAACIGADPTERPLWVVGRNVVPVMLGAVALGLLLAQLGNLTAALRVMGSADPAWLAAAAGLTMGGYVMAAVSMTGASPERLALGRTTVVQLAAAFANRIAPAGLGAMATNARYLERSGVRRARAVTAVGVNQAAGGLVHVAALLVVLPLAGRHAPVPVPPTPDFDSWPVVVVILVGLSLAGFWYLRHGLGRVLERIRPHARDLRGIVVAPRRAALLFGGSLGLTLSQALVFVAALAAVGVHRSILTGVAVFLTGTALAAAAPTPGGLGAIEAALVAGLAQVGVATTPAVAAVLVARVIGYWLPILPGWFAFRLCRRDDTL